MIEGIDFITIKGSHNEAKVFNTHVESTAQTQIIKLCSHDAFKDAKIRIMPDVHAGAGCVIGFTADLGDKVVPNLVGVDIGCGVSAYNTGNTRGSFSFPKFDEHLRERVPFGFHVNDRNRNKNEELAEKVIKLCKKLKIDSSRVLKSIGSLGGGNHYIELNELSFGEVLITVHSGSRNLGKVTADYHQKKAVDFCKMIHAGVSKDLSYLVGEDRDEYLHDMYICQELAMENRMVMLEVLMGFFHKEFDRNKVINSTHNYIDPIDNIIRKGAIKAASGETVLIPMNMRDGLIIARGLGNTETNNSAPHGAGRLYGRRVAKETLSVDKFKQDMNGIFSTCVGKSTLDECPDAYKSMDKIIPFLKPMVSIVEIAKPIYNFKA